MKPRVELNALLRHLRAEFGTVSALEQLDEGEESRAFSFRSDQDDLVVRLNPSASGFLKDKLARSRFHGPALPVPEILSINRFDGLSICVSRRATGQTLQEIGTPSPAVLAAVMDVLDALADVDVTFTSGFGHFDEHGVASFPSWQAFLLAPTTFDWPQTAAHLDPSSVAIVLDQLARRAQDCPEVRGLAHADFGSNNVLVSEERITGIIDWSEALIGDPHYDLANIFFWRDWLECMGAQADYAEALGIPTPLQQRLVCFQLRIGLEEAFSAALAGEAAMANWSINRCLALI